MQFRKQRLVKEIDFHVKSWLRNYYDQPDIVKHVRLTGVVVAADLSHVKLYVYWNKEDCSLDVLAVLAVAVSQVRKLISQKIGFKKAPVLRFYYDTEQEKLNELSALVSGLAEEVTVAN